MVTKLNRGKIIKKYIGEGLADLGFSYKGYEDEYVFERKQGELIWYVGISVYRFAPWQITFDARTNIKGQFMAQEVKLGIIKMEHMKLQIKHCLELLQHTMLYMVRQLQIFWMQHSCLAIMSW